MTTAILALQGAFAEHADALEQLGETCIELRQASDLHAHFDRLVLPGGESTVQTRLLNELEMLVPLRERIESGMPVLGTCAGLVLLARDLVDADGERNGGRRRGERVSYPRFATLPVRAQRNAYDRQLASFRARAALRTGSTVPATFIRAPRIADVGPNAEVLARVDETPVAVLCGKQLACAFHPELDDDLTIHEMFLAL